MLGQAPWSLRGGTFVPGESCIKDEEGWWQVPWHAASWCPGAQTLSFGGPISLGGVGEECRQGCLPS